VALPRRDGSAGVHNDARTRVSGSRVFRTMRIPRDLPREDRCSLSCGRLSRDRIDLDRLDGSSIQLLSSGRSSCPRIVRGLFLLFHRETMNNDSRRTQFSNRAYDYAPLALAARRARNGRFSARKFASSRIYGVRYTYTANTFQLR
jgi:hypothetical protein